MQNTVLLTPLRYLSLRDEKNRALYLSNLTVVAGLTFLLSAPFIFISSSNYFHKDGFIDKVGAFSSVLTGFYVAGLLAVATFSEKLGNLDSTIEVGRISLPGRDKDDICRFLTRREYVCAIFGYLAFMSLIVTLLSITTVTLAQALPAINDLSVCVGKYNLIISKDFIRALPIVMFSALAAHLNVVTGHGLYYLMDRLYAKKAELLPEREERKLGDE